MSYQVERIILKGYAGLGLHDIKEFDFTIRAKTMIVLGGNGCGKSSFLGVYFPIALAKTDFRVGGSYVNYSKRDDVKYRFSMKRTEANLQCSIKNLSTGEYICKDVNPKVYNAHVEDITGLNKEIVDLLNGNTRLTKANSTTRKAWFTMLSTTDLSHGLSFYKKLRTAHRDLGAVCDHLSRKIAEIKLRVVENDEERTAIKARLAQMEQEIREYSSPAILELEEMRSHTAAPLSYFMEQQGRRAQNLANEVLEIPRDANMSDEHLAGLMEEAQAARDTVSRIDGEIGALNRELAEHENALQRQAYLMRNHEGLKVQLDDVSARFKASTAAVDEFTHTHLPELPINQLQAAEKQLGGLLQNIARELENITGNERLAVVEEQVKVMESEISSTTSTVQYAEMRIREIEHDLSHYDQTDDVECPQCQHVFKPGVLKTRDSLVLAHNHMTKTRDEAETRRRELSEERGPALAKLRSMRALREIVIGLSEHPVLSGLIKTMYSEEVLTVNRARLRAVVGKFEHELAVAIEHVKLKAQLATVTTEWEAALASVGDLDPKLLNKAEETRTRLELLSASRKTAMARESQYNDSISVINNYRTTMTAFSDLQERMRDAVEATYVEALWDTVTRNKDRLLDTYSACRTRWSAMEAELKQLADLEQEHAEHVERRYTAGHMIQAWSPEKGVLQKYYFKAIRRITEMMNHHIRCCWSYEMQVLPCSADNGDLNYQFPYLLKDKPQPVSDVAKSSTGQSEIIDLAFRLVAYNALKLTEYPLLLDEPATGFDENHRGALVDFIKQLLDQNMFSQMLVVSHLPDVHTRLREAEYCVIEKEGVTLPERYNESIRIIYEGDS